MKRSAKTVWAVFALVIALFAGSIWYFEVRAETAKHNRAFAGLAVDVLGDEPDLRTMPFGDLRQVTLEFVDDSSRDYMVHKSQVDRFVEASKKLHYEDGNGAPKIKRIFVGEPDPDGGPYWWSTPNLKKNGDYEHGAVIYDFKAGVVVWRSAEEQQTEEKEKKDW
jgi:hypothetical protein